MTTRSEQLRLHARSVGNEDPLAALELYDQAVAIEDASPGDVATALKDKAVTLALLGRSDEALALFCQVIETYGHSDEAQIRAAVDKSLMNKAVLQSESGMKADAISCHDEVADRNRQRTDIESRRTLAKSFLAKGEIVQSYGTDEAVVEAITCYVLASRTLEKSLDPVLMQVAARSLLFEGLAIFTSHRGFVQTFSWWSRRSLFKRFDKAILLLAKSPQDDDDSLLLAARAVRMKALFLGKFGYPRAAAKTKTFRIIAQHFGAGRAKRIIGFMEIEDNLSALAAHAGTLSLGVFL